DQSETQAREVIERLSKQAIHRMTEHYAHEIQRLQALKKHNPSVRQEEIEILQDHGIALHHHLQKTRLKLDAVRLVVTV
ncbi:MAG: hypothetical protein P8101_21980, partial [Candidatus Thiodiazotropha sp.]